jgi:hypothetical protein
MNNDIVSTPQELSFMNNPLGASPRSTIIKFIILSMCVGAFLAWSGQTPRTLLYNLQYGFEALFGVGFDAFKNLFQYFLYGAVIVLPIWVLTRVLGKK